MKHLVIVFCMSLFVLIFVWQNVEMMKMKLECRKLSAVAGELIKDNDRILFGIERYRSMENVEHHALRSGLKKITPSDFDVVVVQNGTK